MPFQFLQYQDANRNRVHQWAGESSLRDHLVRTQLGYQDFTISAAEMDALAATPKTILVAPGSGLVTLVTEIVTFVDAGSTPFELGSGVLSFKYTDGSGASVVADVPNASVESATDVYYKSIGVSVAAVANAPIVASASADVTAGNGVIYGRIYFLTLDSASLLVA